MKQYVVGKSINASVITDIINATYQGDCDLAQFRDALSLGQVASKLWLDDEVFQFLPEGDLSILVVGGWIGSLSRILLQSLAEFRYEDMFHITSLDIDPEATRLARIVNERFTRPPNTGVFEAITRNMYDLKPEDYERFNVVINTSCEHILNVQKWSDVIPTGTLVVGQSNDFFKCPQHCNCVRSEKELEDQLNLSKVLFSDRMILDGMYTRFMVIGVK